MEDHDDYRETIAEVICSTGRVLSIALAGTAHDALGRLREERFDLIVTDVALPNMSGLEMLDRARGEGLISETTTIVVCSANSAFQPQAVARGATFLPKPVDFATLVEVALHAHPAPA